MRSEDQSNKSFHYEGLYRGAPANAYNYIFSEAIQARSKQFDWEINQHFHSKLYQVFMGQKGGAELHVNEMMIPLKAPFIICIPPNFSHGFKFSEDIEGHILTFSEVYVRGLKGIENFYSDILTREVRWVTDVRQEEYDRLYKCYQYIHEEVFNSSAHRYAALQLSIAQFILLMSRMELSGVHTTVIKDRNLAYFRTFVQLIHQYKDPNVSMAEYAGQLHISVGHLNRICRKVKDCTPLQVIQDMFVTRAKAYLQHTTYNINEIAYQLGFEDASYFTRLFKKQTGLTPGAYRKELSQPKQ